MQIYLGDPNTPHTTVSIDEIRNFISELTDISKSITKQRQELKTAIEDDEKIKEFKETLRLTKESLKTYIESNGVYREYQDKIDALKEDRRDLISEAKQKGVPKKEVEVAIKMLKQDIDPEVSTEIYSNISDLVE